MDFLAMVLAMVLAMDRATTQAISTEKGNGVEAGRPVKNGVDGRNFPDNYIHLKKSLSHVVK